MPADMLARGVARVTLEANRSRTIYYAADMRKRNTAREARRAAPILPSENTLPRRATHAIELLDEDTPFGWLPPDKDAQK